MLRASLLADARILPQARQGSYFFNRIGQNRPAAIYLRFTSCFDMRPILQHPAVQLHASSTCLAQMSYAYCRKLHFTNAVRHEER